MQELFNSLFAGMGFSEVEIRKFEDDFSGLAMVAALGAASIKFAETDEETLESKLQANDFEGAFAFAQEKYGGDWNKLMRDTVEPLLSSYIKEVVPARA